MVFGDSDVQNGAILEWLSGLHVHYIAAYVYLESHSVLKVDPFSTAVIYSSE